MCGSLEFASKCWLLLVLAPVVCVCQLYSVLVPVLALLLTWSYGGWDAWGPLQQSLSLLTIASMLALAACTIYARRSIAMVHRLASLYNVPCKQICDAIDHYSVFGPRGRHTMVEELGMPHGVFDIVARFGQSPEPSVVPGGHDFLGNFARFRARARAIGEALYPEGNRK